MRAAQEIPSHSPSRRRAALVESLPAGVACIDAEMRVVLANGAFSAALGVARDADLRGAPEPLARLGAAAREAIASQAAAELDLGDGLGRARVFPIDEDCAGVLLSGPASAEAMRIEEQAALLRVATLLAQNVDEEAVFAAVAQEAAGLVGVQAGSVLRFLGNHRAVVVGSWRGGGTRGMPVNAELDFDARNSALGRVRSTGRPSRADSYDGLRGELPVVMRAIGVRSSVAAPVAVREEVWGAVVAATTGDEPPAPGSEDRIACFGELVALAVVTGEARRRLAGSRLRMVEAADDARRRLERSLHEGAHQHVLALALKLRVACARPDTGPELAELLEGALSEAMQANASLRELARALYPAVLSERGLAAALQALAARSAVPVHLLELPARRFPRVVEGTAYFVVAESLDNVAKHAQATEATLLVADRRDHLLVEVRDDGVGGANPPEGCTLLGLSDRAAALGGRFEVDSPVGRGTLVRAELPIER